MLRPRVPCPCPRRRLPFPSPSERVVRRPPAVRGTPWGPPDAPRGAGIALCRRETPFPGRGVPPSLVTNRTLPPPQASTSRTAGAVRTEHPHRFGCSVLGPSVRSGFRCDGGRHGFHLPVQHARPTNRSRGLRCRLSPTKDLPSAHTPTHTHTPCGRASESRVHLLLAIPPPLPSAASQSSSIHR